MTEFYWGDKVRGTAVKYPYGLVSGVVVKNGYCSGCVRDTVRISDSEGTLTCLHPGSVSYVDKTGTASVPESTPREQLLAEAAQLVTGDRNATYGAPTGNFQDTATIWNVYLNHKLAEGQALTAGDVAAMMVGLKLARIKASPKKDNWADIAGYAACGYECDINTGAVQEES